MPRFFSGWPLWEKLVFVLACAIFITMLLGCTKLAYTHWKLRKYAAAAETEKKEQAVRRQMSERTHRRRQLEDIPFGIRAIESGIEVEGVWISRSNTPEPASRESSGNSMWNYAPHKSWDLEKLQHAPVFGRDASASTMSTTSTARHTISGPDRAMSAERLPSSQSSRDSSPDAPITRPARSRHPPSTLTKYSNNPYLFRQDSTTLDGINAIYRASGPMQSRKGDAESGDEHIISSGESSSGSNGEGSIAASAPRLLNNDTRPRHPSANLDLMQSHRMSQAAEVGQITPRVRRPGSSSDWARITSANDLARPANGYPGQSRTRSHSTPKEPGLMYELPAVPAATQISMYPVRPAARRTSMPEAIPFAKFCQTAPLSPLQATSISPSGASIGASWPLSEPLSLEKPAVSEQSSISPVPHSAEAEPKRTSFEKRKSDILRGQGTGFEILLPGTLKPPAPAEHPMERQRAAPPISLQNYHARSRSSSTDSRRKLKKKRRSSIESHSSRESGVSSRVSQA